MIVTELLENLKNYKTADAIAKDNNIFTYSQLLERIEFFASMLNQQGLKPGESICLISNYSFDAISCLFALLINRNILTIVLPNLPENEKEFFIKTSEAKHTISFTRGHNFQFNTLNNSLKNKYLLKLKQDNEPGLIIYTSGTTGQPKGAVHSADNLLSRFLKKRKPYVTISSLLFDHIGGLDILFSTLLSGGLFVLTDFLSTRQICEHIEKYKVELFPVSATLLKFIIISEEYKNFDLSSVKVITYGSEVMSERVLKKTREIFPNARLKQTFGMTETGTLSTISKDSDSLFLKFALSNQNIKVENNTLWVKALTSMLGYLNAPSPFEKNGWLDTGDEVEVDGEWIRFLGRKTDIINVGGQKVYPQEVESVINELPFIQEISVSGEQHPLLGQIVTARVVLKNGIAKDEAKKLIRRRCSLKLANYKVPQKIVFVENVQYNYRLKKIR